ncbi:MAG: CRISPR-associated helicase Cas3', partial [Desulfobacteraceae bacterium]
MSYFRYWAKASQNDSGRLSYHLLPYHSLDVAAAGLTILERDFQLMARLERCSGLSEALLKAMSCYLLAIHDIGKFSVRFQNLRPDITATLQPERECRQGYAAKHDDMGFWLWERVVLPMIHSTRLLPVDSDDIMDWNDLITPLAKAVIGHHGRPPQSDPSYMDCFGEVDRDATGTFAAALASMFFKEDLPHISMEPFEVLEVKHKRLSWIFAGLCIVADWLGSDSRHFPFVCQEVELEDYWIKEALPSARKAVESSGLLPPQPKPAKGFVELLPHLSNQKPTPLQVHAADSQLPPGPQLHIFEDATGSGKTEAAIIYAHRLMKAGLAEGIFVALPTMATANAMYLRMAEVYRNLFVEDGRPSLTLAHGARHLSRKFLESIELEGIPRRDLPHEESAEATCSSWLADNRKKALLAATGVGTVDQALLGVLPSRHQSLRLFGLGRSAIIVDEVHSYDPYMHGLLCKLLTFQAAQGGSAILLSATLPAKTKTELARAFGKGLDCEVPGLASGEYPLVTSVSRELADEIHVSYRDEPRNVSVRLIHEKGEVENEIISAASSGGCTLWIRNTVQDALEARLALLDSGRVSSEEVILFHARFAACDRLVIEERILSTFGLDGRADDRRRKIVIATQVAEQSLDVDFDFLVTDLAPIDLVLQRIGRWRRHNRERPKGTPDSVYVYSPRLDSEPQSSWYPSMFPGGAYVYPFQSKLWLTANLLAEKGGYRIPDDARRLIEGVYGEESENLVPEALREADNKAHADAMAK